MQNLNKNSQKLYEYIKNNINKFDCNSLRFSIDEIKNFALKNDKFKATAIDALTLLSDMRYDTGRIKRSSILSILKENIDEIFASTKKINEKTDSIYCAIDFNTKNEIRAPQNKEEILIIDAEKFKPEGDLCDANLIVKAYHLGWKKFIVYKYRGQRFTGCGFGPGTEDVKIALPLT